MSGIHDYSDIYDIPRPEPKYHHRMSAMDRAAQFAPFAALTGFSGMIEETGRITEDKIILDDNEKERINRRLKFLAAEAESQPEVEVTYFAADRKKSGGSYQTIIGKLKKIDLYNKLIVFTDGVRIEMETIINIDRKN